jgi:two-component system, chemotaxis family, response regulator Rcp1
MENVQAKPVEILLVEDSPSDTELTVEALREAKMRNNLSIVEDGAQAMQFLRRQGQFTNAPRPDLILLDLNLPRKDGREVLAEIKADKNLATIHVVVLTASDAQQDILRAQELQVNGYVTKPVEFCHLWDVVRTVESFGIVVVSLPSNRQPYEAAETRSL